MVKKFGLSLIMTILLLFFVSTASAPATELEEDYDENTEFTIKGTVAEIVKGMRGPVILRITYQKRVYSIVTAPLWYLNREKISFEIDSSIEITGSKYFGKDGQIYVIARKIKDLKTGREILLRNSQCQPMWRGMRNR